MFKINFNKWKCACVWNKNVVTLLAESLECYYIWILCSSIWKPFYVYGYTLWCWDEAHNTLGHSTCTVLILDILNVQLLQTSTIVGTVENLWVDLTTLLWQLSISQHCFDSCRFHETAMTTVELTTLLWKLCISQPFCDVCVSHNAVVTAVYLTTLLWQSLTTHIFISLISRVYRCRMKEMPLLADW